MADRHYTVLGNAEAYMSDIERVRSGGTPEPHRTLDQARAALLPQLERVEAAVKQMPKAHRLDEVVVELRLDVSRMAKSYHPEDLLRAVGLHLRGVGTWQQNLRRDRVGTRGHTTTAEDEPGSGSVAGAVVTSRMLLVSGKDEAISALRSVVATTAPGQRFERDIIGLEQVRVPTVEDHIALQPTQEARTAVEIVLYAWDDRRRDQAITAVQTMLTSRSAISPDDILVRSYSSGPTFIAAVLPTASVPALGELNFLRLTRTLPRVQLTRTSIGMAIPAPPAPAQTIAPPAAAIAVFDGGVAPLPQFRGLVHYTELTKVPCTPKLLDHGTGVVSAALFGDLVAGQPLPPPRCQVYAYRVLPDPRGSEIDMWGVIDAIEATVPRLPREVQVVNLSLGPEGPIDNVPSRFTYAIDRLSFEHDKLFVTAVGNWGDHPNPDFRRLQSPSDAVNALSVGAFTRVKTSGKPIPAPYGSVGPGRAGGYDKPELYGFGGCPNVPFNALSGTPGFVTGTDGTSFASPPVAALAAQIISGRAVKTQGCRALLIDARTPADAGADGTMMLTAETLDEALGCSPTRVSVLYQGEFTPRLSWRLPFLLPRSVSLTGNVTLSWTIVFCCDVDHAAHEEYTLGGLEVQLRPNANRFTWSPPKEMGARSVELHAVDDRPKIFELEALGWKRSENPVADSKRRRTERMLRSAEAKWETIVRGSCGKRGLGLEDPALTVSFLGRSTWGDEHAMHMAVAPFAAVLTIDAARYEGDLYVAVAQAHAQLRALSIANQAAIPVTIGRPPTPRKP